MNPLLGIPAFFLDAPAWAMALIAVVLGLTLVGIVLLATELRRGKAIASA